MNRPESLTRMFGSPYTPRRDVTNADRRKQQRKVGGARLIHVWSEHGGRGAAWDAGYYDGHTIGIHHGSAMATSLREAADKVFRTEHTLGLGLPEYDPCYDRERMTHWGEDIFEREPRYV